MSTEQPRAAHPSGLGERERAVLDFERDWRAHQGAKEEAIRETFGISPARYYQLLARVTERDAAFTYDPLLVARLRRRRGERERERTARALGERPSR